MLSRENIVKWKKYMMFRLLVLFFCFYIYTQLFLFLFLIVLLMLYFELCSLWAEPVQWKWNFSKAHTWSPLSPFPPILTKQNLALIFTLSIIIYMFDNSKAFTFKDVKSKPPMAAVHRSHTIIVPLLMS